LLSEHSRNSHAILQEYVKDLFQEVSVIQEMVQQGAVKTEIEKHLQELRLKQDMLEKSIKSLCKL
jgi:hypothetical protein